MQENQAFFNSLFFNKMPRKLRILLSEVDMGDEEERTSSGPTASSWLVGAAVKGGPSSHGDKNKRGSYKKGDIKSKKGGQPTSVTHSFRAG